MQVIKVSQIYAHETRSTNNGFIPIPLNNAPVLNLVMPNNVVLPRAILTFQERAVALVRLNARLPCIVWMVNQNVSANVACCPSGVVAKAALHSLVVPPLIVSLALFLTRGRRA